MFGPRFSLRYNFVYFLLDFYRHSMLIFPTPSATPAARSEIIPARSPNDFINNALLSRLTLNGTYNISRVRFFVYSLCDRGVSWLYVPLIII